MRKHGSRNAWTRMRNVNGASRLSNFWNFFDAIQMISCRARLVTMDETWLYHYGPWRQSNNQWSGGIAAHPPRNIPSAKIHWKISRLVFLESRRHPSHWLPSKGSNYQRGVLLISAGVTEGHFDGKTPREIHQMRLVFARQFPGSLGTSNPEETGLPVLPVSWSPTLLSGSGPVGLPPVPWIENNSWKVSIFRTTRRSLLPRRPGWTDKFLNLFFEWLAKVRATG